MSHPERQQRSMKLMFLFFISFSLSSLAESKLDKFEKNVTSRKDEKKESGSFLEFLFSNVIFSDSSDSQTSTPKTSSRQILEQGNEPVAEEQQKFRFSLDYGYLWVDDSIHAHQYGLHVGYKWFEVAHSTCHYFEKNPTDRLRFSNTALLYALSATKSLRWSLGPGVVTMKGNNSTSRASMMSLAQIRFAESENYSFGIKLDSIFYWLSSNSLNKNDLSFDVKFEMLTIEAGYQWHYARNTLFELNGPYVGLALSY